MLRGALPQNVQKADGEVSDDDAEDASDDSETHEYDASEYDSRPGERRVG